VAQNKHKECNASLSASNLAIKMKYWQRDWRSPVLFSRKVGKKNTTLANRRARLSKHSRFCTRAAWRAGDWIGGEHELTREKMVAHIIPCAKGGEACILAIQIDPRKQK